MFFLNITWIQQDPVTTLGSVFDKGSSFLAAGKKAPSCSNEKAIKVFYEMLQQY